VITCTVNVLNFRYFETDNHQQIMSKQEELVVSWCSTSSAVDVYCWLSW